MIRIEAIDVVKSGIKVLHNFSLDINRGEHWLLRGPNGSGKTVLLEVIAGITTPSAGHIEYDFISASDWDQRFAERKKKIHYVSTHAMNNFLAGHHDLFYQQRYYEIEDMFIPKVRDLLDAPALHVHSFSFPPSFQIDSLLDLDVTRLSNGQLKKVLILKTLLLNIPDILLLDYPFDGLDHASRQDLIDFIDFIVEKHGIQLIMTDHHDQVPRCINKTLTFKKDRSFQISNHVADTVSHPSIVPIPELESTTIPVVDLKNITIQYGEKIIIKDLTWTIRQGERWALTGRNGCGKTTLFSLLYADHPLAYTQNIYLFGRKRGSGESIWDIKKRINYFGPEHLHYLNPRGIPVTARNYIFSLHFLDDVRTKLEELIEYFDASGFIDKPVRSLSSGDLQLTLLINFFLDERELLLLDEPFQFLDHDRTNRVNDYLGKFLRPETTLILITHLEDEIRRWTRHRMRL